MNEKVNINPLENELPSNYADRLGIYYAKQVTQKHKKDNGQFFTPLVRESFRVLKIFSLCKFANQSLGRQWKMKQEKLSNSYTTRIDQVITIMV